MGSPIRIRDFLDHVVNKKAEIVRVYLPSRRELPAVRDGSLPAQQTLRERRRRRQASRAAEAVDGRGDQTLQRGHRHLAVGEQRQPRRAGRRDGDDAGDVPTLETLAAVSILREHLPSLRVRVVNVVDLMKLQPTSEHPHGMSDYDFDSLFTRDKPVIFAFHGYPGSFIGSPIGGTITATCMCADTRKRAPSPPRSI